MSSLEQSLDAIIASSKKPALKKKPFKGTKKTVKPTKVGKAAAGKNAKKPIVLSKPAPAPASAVDYASKVVVYGLPKDIKNDAVKEFFQSQIGGVKTVSLSYNEKGQSKGIATVIFQKSKQAQKAVESYNGAPIDGGKTTLRLELIVDPAMKPLASRIVPNQAVAPALSGKVASRKAAPKKAKPVQKKVKPAKKAAPKKKKTVEELDQEMADYFSSNDKQ
ncbi:hypothetical protein KL918_005240 [Ogataea parapolymorpha]|uniref:YRA1 Nuclear protein n=1 Tax=Ogataea parapolymorpha (strain ATCC 26012 / BCRC 20466 / JCM 22074 / NRRL Y-7560 / DL-1) TaxID=871575 RepID=W1QES1_OGAPD|nr:YRA1 Nuclear protein [Ogataea parapolymorpha DL-1]ESX00053.1 YRA1 Nuclear protein [Ogataea parapolymorpha DL-1]KAG7864749.1 hypothetical protein KL918_005240 [Ogataea parapolymorpha]KAG7870949.1 hypothetical protein KL916_004500 [Ogataea parapolymorpha]KAG7873071.1 hypothetical protein KL938_005187 [Ogataea parapolymorpha]